MGIDNVRIKIRKRSKGVIEYVSAGATEGYVLQDLIPTGAFTDDTEGAARVSPATD